MRPSRCSENESVPTRGSRFVGAASIRKFTVPRSPGLLPRLQPATIEMQATKTMATAGELRDLIGPRRKREGVRLSSKRCATAPPSPSHLSGELFMRPSPVWQSTSTKKTFASIPATGFRRGAVWSRSCVLTCDNPFRPCATSSSRSRTKALPSTAGNFNPACLRSRAR